MEFLKTVGRAVENAAIYLGEKNRRAAALNRIRAVIRCEEKAAQKEYLALGRYYYNNLRDKNNAVTESHCAQLEEIDKRLNAAVAQLEKFYAKPEEECEEVTLEDVESFDQDPTLPQEETPAATAEEEEKLPFEG